MIKNLAHKLHSLGLLMFKDDEILADFDVQLKTVDILTFAI